MIAWIANPLLIMDSFYYMFCKPAVIDSKSTLMDSNTRHTCSKYNVHYYRQCYMCCKSIIMNSDALQVH